MSIGPDIPHPRPVLILRPQPGADATAARARQCGLTPLLYPLFRVAPLPWDAPDPAGFDALMLTSANSLIHGGAALSLYHILPVFAVGAATARAARDHGFAHVTTTGPDATALLRAIEASPHRRLLHLCGKDRRAYDPGTLHITRRAVYHAAETGTADGLESRLIHNPVLLVHSPRAGKRVAALIPPPRRASLAIIAISANALNAAEEGWERAVAIPTPDDALMLDMARQICQIG